MLPTKQMWFKALLGVENDLPKIWESISKYNRVNLGGENGKYTVYFTGSIEDGLLVLNELLKTSSCQVELNTNF